MATTQTIEAGFDAIYYGFNDANGFYQGADPDSAPAAGDQDGSGMNRLVGAQTVPLSPSEAEVVNVLGDDEPLTQFSFESPDLPSGVLQTATEDLTLEAWAQGTKVQTLGDNSIGMRQPTGTTPASLCMSFQRQAKDWTIGSLGVSKRASLWVPRAELRPRGPADITQRQHSPTQWNIVTSKTDRQPWGATLSSAANGTTSAALIPIKSSYILQVHRWTGDGTEDNFFLPYVAVGTLTTLFIFINGQIFHPTTHYTVTPDTPTGKTTIAFVSPPANNAKVNCLYGVSGSNI